MLLSELTRTMQSRVMIRERHADGYKEELGVDIIDIAAQSVRTKGSFTWYDMCCGKFRAAWDVNDATQGQAICVGVDVWTLLDEPVIEMGKNVRIERDDVTNYPLPPDVDLVTCLKGLRYIEQYQGRDTMLSTVTKWRDALSPGSRLVAEATDLSYPYGESPPYLVNAFGEAALRYVEESGCLVIDVTIPDQP